MTNSKPDVETKTVEDSEHFDMILRLKNFKKYFPVKSGILQRTTGYLKAVDNISLDVRKGETIGIVGESGCGKSTLARSIIRLYEPTDGDIIYKETNISKLPESKLRPLIRRNIQMIFQDPFASLNPRKTLGNILEEPYKVHNIYNKKERTEEIKSLLNRVGLNESFINRYPHEFSGGQRQRIAIARTLTTQPELIIADEPVSALDVSIQAQIINLLESLQEEFNLTFVFISHDLSIVRHIADRVGVMYLGKLMELSPKNELYEEPLHPYTQSLISAIPKIRKSHEPKRERIILKGEIPNPENPPKGCIFHTRCPMAFDKCFQVEPEFIEHEKDRFVACHLYQ